MYFIILSTQYTQYLTFFIFKNRSKFNSFTAMLFKVWSNDRTKKCLVCTTAETNQLQTLILKGTFLFMNF